MDIVFLDLAKAFDKVPHGRLLEKLRKHGIDGKLLRTIGNWLSGRRQTVCIKGKQSNWRKFGVVFPRVLYCGLLFLIFINDLEDYTSNTDPKFSPNANPTPLTGTDQGSSDFTLANFSSRRPTRTILTSVVSRVICVNSLVFLTV